MFHRFFNTLNSNLFKVAVKALQKSVKYVGFFCCGTVCIVDFEQAIIYWDGK